MATKMSKIRFQLTSMTFFIKLLRNESDIYNDPILNQICLDNNACCKHSFKPQPWHQVAFTHQNDFVSGHYMLK